MDDRHTLRISDLIRDRRFELRLRQADVGLALGITGEAVLAYERGKRTVPLRNVVRLARILQLDPVALGRLALREQAPELFEVLFGTRSGGGR